MFPYAVRLFSITSRHISTSISSFYDGVIVGGGMVGNAMACSIGLSNLLNDKKFLLLESASPKPLVKSPTYNNRTSTVLPASVEFFKKIGVWDKFLDYRVKRVDRYEVIDTYSHSTVSFDFPYAEGEVVYIVENNVIVSHLLNRVMDACKNITLKTNAKVVHCKIPDSLLEDALLVLDDGTEIETSLVIGADGGNSIVRQSLSPDYTWWNYGQKGVVAVLEIEDVGSNNSAWQRFSRFGPIALLPLSNRNSNLIWTTSDAHAEELLALKPEEFINALNSALFTEQFQNSVTNKTLALLDQVLNSVFNVGKTPVPTPPRIVGLQKDSRAAFPLAFGHSHTYVSTRAALIGDAAHRIHPLSGLGANIGWSDVRKLTTCLEKCVSDGADLGSLTYLSEFDTEAQRSNVPQQIACDWINRIYRTNCLPSVLLRSLGMYATNHLPYMKGAVQRTISNM